MSRGRKTSSYQGSNNWEDIFWNSLPIYIGILNNYFTTKNYEMVAIGNCLKKLSFTIPKGLNSKEIHSSGKHPVISQSKEFIIGFSDRTDLLVNEDLPLIVFGDHSKTIKYVDEPFVIGADGVKLIKPISSFNERFFYYFIFGIITDTKDYGRHFSLLRNGLIAKVEDVELQIKVVEFLDALKSNSFSNKNVFFNASVEKEIYELQKNQLNGNSISTELNHQLDLVKKLRQQLLQDAVQGKLVEQNPNDETASELLKKIKAEKEKLIAEKKLKKEKEKLIVNQEDVPFELPKNWSWCNLGELAILNARIGWKGLNASEYKKEGPLFLSVHSLNYGDYVDYSQAFHISQERYDESPEIMLKDNDILICKDGAGIGKIGIIKDLKKQATTNSSLLVIRCFNNLNVKFIYYYLISGHFQNIVQARIMGATTPHLYQRDLVHFYVALPPLLEQNRIVQKLDELMQHCNDLEASIKQSQQQNEKLLQQVLREALRGETVEN